ncbi:MAG: glycine cleavage system protein GcvH [Chloroflexota bacterium]|nr:glycine cleavage system protein GcvH [Chloroflexota bacterium]MDE2941831.1 glycine cleavage system protein GcvH [Chloroflexota bacterium]MDE3266858.1 glycine cleavage system protein GcvH [Chloroflexota bacterium]
MHPEDRRYSREHEWARDEGDGTVLVGITDYAQEHLGDIVFLELPPVGTQLDRNQKFGEVESVKSVSDIFSPVSGEVVAVNDVVVDSPEMVNEDPHGSGWLVRLRPSQPSEMDELMSAADYESMLESLE